MHSPSFTYCAVAFCVRVFLCGEASGIDPHLRMGPTFARAGRWMRWAWGPRGGSCASRAARPTTATPLRSSNRQHSLPPPSPGQLARCLEGCVQKHQRSEKSLGLKAFRPQGRWRGWIAAHPPPSHPQLKVAWERQGRGRRRPSQSQEVMGATPHMSGLRMPWLAGLPEGGGGRGEGYFQGGSRSGPGALDVGR